MLFDNVPPHITIDENDYLYSELRDVSKKLETKKIVGVVKPAVVDALCKKLNIYYCKTIKIHEDDK